MGEATILIVDDEAQLREVISLYLTKNGFKAITAEDGEEALRKVRKFKPTLVVLDLMLPKIDGWDVCREIRKSSKVPIIMLTARGEEFDRVLGLELGADDYMCKPFSPRELVARIKAVLRRVEVQQQNNINNDEILTYPGLEISLSSRKLFIDGQETELTPREFELLWFLAQNPGRVYSRDQLLASVWGYDFFGDSRTVDTHIKRLREKIEKSGEHSYLKTVWGTGYKFEA